MICFFYTFSRLRFLVKQKNKILIPCLTPLLAEMDNFDFFNPNKLRNLSAEQMENAITCSAISTDLLTCPIEAQRLYILNLLSTNTKFWSLLTNNKTVSSYSDSLVNEISTKIMYKSLPRHVSLLIRNQTRDDGIFLMIDQLELGYEICACKLTLSSLNGFFVSPQLNITFSSTNDEFDTIRISSIYNLTQPNNSLQFNVTFDLKNTKSGNDS